ncbi:MAG: ABC transporter substrate-binding protein [Bryobacteraceae bacterium]|nr:ABC transporter substrate-binding protein [Bryobacteraceae bacterium]
MPDQPAPTPDPVQTSTLRKLWGQLSQSWPVRFATQFVILPLIGVLVSGIVIGRLADGFFGPKNYVVVVVGDESDPAARRMLAAAARPLSLEIDGVQVKTETRSDLADPDKAYTLAQELALRPDVLMVVGHGSSSVSMRVLPIYMQADPPVPVILTTDTNPGLLPPLALDDDRIRPVFRLFPTDDNQAEVGARFVASRRASSVWIIEDAGNPTYSHYLARAFLNVLYEKYGSINVVLWSSNSSLPPYAFDRLGFDWVFFAGDWRNALILLRQLQAIPGKKKPSVLLSDGAVDGRLKFFGGENLEGVYLLHPLSADQFSRNGNTVVGEEAHSLVSSLIDAVDRDFGRLATESAPTGYRLRKWLGLRRVSDARRAMSRYMARAVNNGLALGSADGTITMEKDTKTRSVVRKNASFHVWRVEQGRFIEVE